MLQFLAPYAKQTHVRVARTLLAIAAFAVLASALPCAADTTLFFSGNLRNDATVLDCPTGCTLNSSSSDSDYAEYAAVVDSFTVGSTSTMSAISYSFGGGTSLTGPTVTVAAGGLEPLLSLFDSTGKFLASTYFETTCPAGAKKYDGNCYDVSLDGGTLDAGTYYIALTDFANRAVADNLGGGNLSEGFTWLGDLQPDEDLHYAFDVILTPNSPPPPPTPAVPEPNYVFLMGIAVGAPFFLKKMTLRTNMSA